MDGGQFREKRKPRQVCVLGSHPMTGTVAGPRAQREFPRRPLGLEARDCSQERQMRWAALRSRADRHLSWGSGTYHPAPRCYT